MKLGDLITFIFNANVISIYGEHIPYLEGYPGDKKFKKYYGHDIDDICSDHDIISIKLLAKEEK